MADKNWGQKRTCSCGKIRFYDLGKNKIECPECGEVIDINFLSNNKIEKNLLKKSNQTLKVVTDKKINKKKPNTNDSGSEIEKETTADIQDTSNLSAKEIIGHSDGKNSNKIDDTAD